MKKYIFAVWLSASLSIQAQNGIKGVDYRACSTAERYHDIVSKNPIIKALMEQQNQFAKEWTKNNYRKTTSSTKKSITYIIPVVWHVIHNDGPENLSKAAIEEEIAKLNEDFQKLNADITNVHPLFAGIAADCQIEFRLARLDPNGNCTEGITRTKSMLTYAMDDIVKTTISPSWNTPTIKYLNIWQGFKIAFDAGGYSYYPGTTSDDTEGVVLIAQQLGNTVTHEVGHYLNLSHTWGDSNDPQDPNNCFDDDYVTDTPNTIGQTGCLATASSCGSIDNVQNYMEYNFCDVMFTEGQKQRMHAALNSPVGYRDLLCSQSNLINTGTADPYDLNPICTPIAGFTYNKTFICEGEQVTFQDHSYNASPTGWNWTFTGGTPSTSTVQNPVVTYNTKGVYSVIHEPYTTAGSGFYQLNDIITVSAINPEYTIPFSESFENLITFNNEWKTYGNSTNNWENVSTASYSGSRSMFVNNLNNQPTEIAQLVSPSYDFSISTNYALSYRYAYAQKLSTGNDILIIYYTTNCGSSWSVLKAKNASSFVTAPRTDNFFIPNSTQWNEEIIDISSLSGLNNVKFKFHLKNNSGNNFWLDDINIGITTGVHSNEMINYTIFPNPVHENAMISFSLTNNISYLSISLLDITGKNISSVVNNQSFNAGKYTLSIDQGKQLSAGLYLLKFNMDGNVIIEKLIIE